MAKVSIHQFIQCKPASPWNVGPDVIDGHMFITSSTQDMSAYGYALVCTARVEFDLPDDFDPRGQQIQALVKQREKLLDEFNESVERINRTISELTAIEYTP